MENREIENKERIRKLISRANESEALTEEILSKVEEEYIEFLSWEYKDKTLKELNKDELIIELSLIEYFINKYRS